jgi:hypothetical protein
MGTISSWDESAWPPNQEPRPASPPVVVPPIVYVPCAPRRSEDAELTVDLRQTREGKLALLAYTALDRLIDCCGPEQPWAVLPTADLEQVRLATSFDIILFDVEIPPEHRRPAEVP